MERLLFDKSLEELLFTIVECILKPSLHDLLRKTTQRVDIVEGFDDFTYIPYTRVIFEASKDCRFHRTLGDHHMIYHHPFETAKKISAIIPVRRRNAIAFL